MPRLRLIAAALGVAGALGAAVHRAHRETRPTDTPGGILVPNPTAYDRLTGWFFRSLFGPIASDIAAVAPRGGSVLEVGCGPGHLSIRLATRHGLQVTALDLDPEMIDRARQNAARNAASGPPVPEFLVGDVAHLPFGDATVDLVVSTYSMHHWADKAAALAEIARVLRPGGRALIWDLRRGFALFHMRAPDPLEAIADGPLVLLGISEWPWPLRFSFTRRLELARPDDVA